MGELMPHELDLAHKGSENEGSRMVVDGPPDYLSIEEANRKVQHANEPVDTNVTMQDTAERETWSKKIDFLLSVIGFAVDLANIWRFPYLCYKNGGGVFLIPYVTMVVFAGVPLFYMELALGQYYRQGAISCWGKICPLFKGIGYCVVLSAFYVDFFYNVIISWALRFFVESFQADLPWPFSRHFLAYYDELADGTKEYYTVSNLGPINWKNLISLAVVYLICYFSLWKGIKMSGKVVWFTAVFPYCVLCVLFVRGVTLPGATDGMYYYLSPNWGKLWEGTIWMDAATQVFFSLGPGFGVLLAFASYNPFHNNIYMDALVTSAINCLTSFVSGFVIFSVLGYMACKSGKNIEDVAAEGAGLVFVVYPEALSTMPGGPIFSIIFFLMLLTLGLDSSFGGSEAIITALSDEFPIIKRKRERFVALLFLFYFCVGILMCTRGGYILEEWIQVYGTKYGLVIAVFCESIVISWIYGLPRFRADIKEMLGFEPGQYWCFCWAYFAPLFLLLNFFVGVGTDIKDGNLKVGGYVIQDWMHQLGTFLAFSSALAIPICATKAVWEAQPLDTQPLAPVGLNLRFVTSFFSRFISKFRATTVPWKDKMAAQRAAANQDTQSLAFAAPTMTKTITDKTGTRVNIDKTTDDIML